MVTMRSWWKEEKELSLKWMEDSGNQGQEVELKRLDDTVYLAMMPDKQ